MMFNIIIILTSPFTVFIFITIPTVTDVLIHLTIVTYFVGMVIVMWVHLDATLTPMVLWQTPQRAL